MFAVMHAKMFFDSFRKGSKKGNRGPVSKRFLLGIGKSHLAAKARKKRRAQSKTIVKMETENNERAEK